MTEPAIIARAADVLIDRATQFRDTRRIHFGVMVRGRNKPSVPTMWRKANMFGVTFLRREIEEARAWAVAAIAAGHTPCVMYRKRASGTVPNEMLELLGKEP